MVYFFIESLQNICETLCLLSENQREKKMISHGGAQMKRRVPQSYRVGSRFWLKEEKLSIKGHIEFHG